MDGVRGLVSSVNGQRGKRALGHPRPSMREIRAQIQSIEPASVYTDVALHTCTLRQTLS